MQPSMQGDGSRETERDQQAQVAARQDLRPNASTAVRSLQPLAESWSPTPAVPPGFPRFRRLLRIELLPMPMRLLLVIKLPGP